MRERCAGSGEVLGLTGKDAGRVQWQRHCPDRLCPERGKDAARRHPGAAASGGMFPQGPQPQSPVSLVDMSEATAAPALQIEVDRGLCFGFGDCVDTAPTVFALDEHNIATVIDPNGAKQDLIFEAAQNCPVDAILITDADGVQLYP